MALRITVRFRFVFFTVSFCGVLMCFFCCFSAAYLSAAESDPAVLLSGVSLLDASAGVFDINELMPQSPSLVPLVVGSKHSSEQSASFLLLCGPDVSALASTITGALSQQHIRRTRMIALTAEQATMLLSAAGAAVQKGNVNELLKSNSAVAFDLRGDSPCDQLRIALYFICYLNLFALSPH
jgi:hypothetical protein